MYLKYLRNSIPEILLCIFILCCVNITIDSGFYISSNIQYNYTILVGLSALIMVLLFAGFYSKRSILITISIIIVLGIIFLVIVRQNTGWGNVFRDEESNPFMYYIVLLVAAISIFLLSRSKIGTIALFVIGIIALTLIQFLYKSNHLYAFFGFIIAAGSLYIFKNYKKTVMTSQTVKLAFGRTFGISILMCVLVIGISAGIFYGVIKPLDMPTKEIKLITREMALPTKNVVGKTDRYIVKDENMTTQKLNEEIKKLQEMNDTERAPDGVKDNEDLEDDNKKNPTILDNSNNPFFFLVNYLTTGYGWIILIAIILLLIITPFLIKILFRKRWIKKVKQESNQNQVRKLYLFYIKKLRRMHIRKQKGDTLNQFLVRAEAPLRQFEVDSAKFEDLTASYIKVNYGNEEISLEELNRYLLFHSVFYKNCRKYLGNFRYILNFFVL